MRLLRVVIILFLYLDVTVAPGNFITYRTIGGILDYFIFMGHTPEMVIQQYTDVSGIRNTHLQC